MSIITSLLQDGTNSHKETVDKFNGWSTHLFTANGISPNGSIVVASPNTGDFAVAEQGTPDMTIKVASGDAIVAGTPTSGVSQRVLVTNNASSNVNIASNSSGSTKYDWIYIKLDPDKMKDPNSAADDVATLVVSRSTSSTTDDGTPPTYGLVIAVVTVANAETSINDAKISDSRVFAARAAGGVWWEELGRKTLKTAADDIAVSSFGARKYLRIIIRIKTAVGTQVPVLTFNGDTGSNYASRYSANGGADGSVASASSISVASAATNADCYAIFEFNNFTSQEKLGFWEWVGAKAAGAGNIPERREGVSKWANTAAQITSLNFSQEGNGDFGIGSEVIVLGHN